jgi:hypothetical protein
MTDLVALPVGTYLMHTSAPGMMGRVGPDHIFLLGADLSCCGVRPSRGWRTVGAGADHPPRTVPRKDACRRCLGGLEVHQRRVGGEVGLA